MDRPVYRPLTEAQRADAAKQPIMTKEEAEALCARVRETFRQETLISTRPLAFVERGGD